MLKFDPQELTERQNYKFLIGTIIPRPIAFITSIGENGTVNGAPFSYFNIVSANPPMISVAIQRKNGFLKDTARNIKRSGEFVVHIVDDSNIEKINRTAASLPPDESEIEKVNLTRVDSEIVSVPGIKEAKVRFECVSVDAIELGEEGNIGTDLIIGKIVQFIIDEEIYLKNGRIYHEKLSPVSRLAGHNYTKIGEVFALKRPE